jgi:peroxiredoxin
MKKLNQYQLAPNFEAMNYLSERINLESYRGKKVWLSFYRYASCPLCNLRIDEISKKSHKL